jgi:hypothetical protein
MHAVRRLGAELRRWVHRAGRPVRWGSLRRTTPVSRAFGLDRGLPVDRHYIEQFLERNSGDIRGRVLEIGDDTYTRRFGRDRVTQSSVLHVAPGNPNASIVGDLESGLGIPAEAFDAFILTQTLQFIFGVQAAVTNAYVALREAGVILATVPGISQISRYDMDRWGDYWRFTDAAAHRLFDPVFGVENVHVETHGNVLAACAFLEGVTAAELTSEELSTTDPDYPVIVTIRAQKR